MIKIKDLEFEYFDRDEEGNLTEMINAIRGINFDVEKGNFVAVAGKNGSGKSTLARILNRLLVAVDGSVIIAGLDARDKDNELEIRKKVGMVFQNPDDQLFGTIVAEDVAFGIENIGVPENELWDRVFYGLEKADLPATKIYASKRINELSGGEKQKCAIAGVLAMQTECIVLDESTAMLDPKSRRELLENIKQLNQELGISVVLITHNMDELMYADYVYIMHMGKIAARGRRQSICGDGELLGRYGLNMPRLEELKNKLYDSKLIRNIDIYNVDGLVNEIKRCNKRGFLLNKTMPTLKLEKKKVNPKAAIVADSIYCSYGKNKILENVSFTIAKGEYVCIMGENGTGKTTLLSHIVGLKKPKSGAIYVDGRDVNDKTTDMQALRCKIGYVFQNPNEQLFATNVYEDVVFGPRNVGISEIEAEKRAYEAISLIGLSEDVYDMPINTLSGGQKRRVQIAGVLAMKPEYLILDEVLAGLDTEGREDMLKIIDILHKEANITIIMVTHDAEVAYRNADRLMYLADGSVMEEGAPWEVFYSLAKKGEWDMIPISMQLQVKLIMEGLPLDKIYTNDDEIVERIKALV